MNSNISPQMIGSPRSPRSLDNRLSVLNQLNDFEAKNIFDFGAITKIATDICRTPTTFIGFFEEDRFVFKSSFEISPETTKKGENICQKVFENNCFAEFLIQERQGGLIYCAGFPLRNSEGILFGVLGVICYNSHTLPEKEKSAMENLAKLSSTVLEQKILTRHKSTQLKFLEESTSIEMYLVSPTTLKIAYANQNALRSLGYPRNLILKKKITDVLIVKKPSQFQQQLLDLAIDKKSSFSAFAEQINSNSGRKLVKLFISFVREGADSSILIIARNLSQVGFESDFVDYLTNYDSITGLANRRSFENLVSEAIHNSDAPMVQSGLLMLNVDNFRWLNQSFGFQIGDKIARQLAKLLVQTTNSNEILIRTTQDSFCLLLPHSNEKQIRQKARDFIDLIGKEEFSENGKKFKLQINIGAVLMDSHKMSSMDYLLIANKACDIAKEFGQNQFYFANPKDELFIRKNIEIEQLVNIQDAIERDRLVLFAQKIGRISQKATNFDEHYEILIRMKNKKNEIISPAAFIPQLETHGSIVSLDKWVLKESLNLIDKRCKELYPPRNAERLIYNINLSARTISDACFVNYCTRLLNQFNHLSDCICFEITETTAISNFAKVKEFMQNVRRFGCKFALDDFGSGGASLECLKELSVDFVKIDGLFVQDVTENPLSQVIIQSICKVAEALKIQVIAEKVENEAIEDKLLDFGVHYIQGFKLHRPAPFVSAN